MTGLTDGYGWDGRAAGERDARKTYTFSGSKSSWRRSLRVDPVSSLDEDPGITWIINKLIKWIEWIKGLPMDWRTCRRFWAKWTEFSLWAQQYCRKKETAESSILLNAAAVMLVALDWDPADRWQRACKRSWRRDSPWRKLARALRPSPLPQSSQSRVQKSSAVTVRSNRAGLIVSCRSNTQRQNSVIKTKLE